MKIFGITKKAIPLLALVLCVSLLTCSCSKDSWVPAGMKLATTDAVDYTMYVPESWTVDLSTGVVSAYVGPTDRSNITMVAMNLENDDATMTLAEYWDKYEADLVATFPDLTYVNYTAQTDESADTTVAAETSAEDETAPVYSESGDRAGNPIATVLGGTAASKFYYTATVTGTFVQYMQVISIRGGIVYIFTYTAVPDSFNLHLEDVEKILENFAFNA